MATGTWTIFLQGGQNDIFRVERDAAGSDNLVTCFYGWNLKVNRISIDDVDSAIV